MKGREGTTITITTFNMGNGTTTFQMEPRTNQLVEEKHKTWSEHLYSPAGIITAMYQVMDENGVPSNILNTRTVVIQEVRTLVRENPIN